MDLTCLRAAESRSLPPVSFVQLCVRYTHLRMGSYAGLQGQTAPAQTAALAAPAQTAEARCPKCVKRRRPCRHLVAEAGARTSVWSRLRGKAAAKSLESVTRISGQPEVAAAGQQSSSSENILQVRRQPLASESRQRSPFVWRETTRSAEHLAGQPLTPTAAPPDLRGAKSHEYLRKYTIDGSGELVPLGLGKVSQSVPGSPHTFGSKKSSTLPNMSRCAETGAVKGSKPRRSLTSFFKQLGPRVLRRASGSRHQPRRPWIVVEFQDVDADVTSVKSDELRADSFSSVPKISLVNSSQRSSREELTDIDLLLDSLRQRRARPPSSGTGAALLVNQNGHSRPAPAERRGPDPAGEPPAQRDGVMPVDKELIRSPHELTTARLIMDIKKESPQLNGAGQDQVDRMPAAHLSRTQLIQQTHTLKASMRSSEVVKQAVRLLSESVEQNGSASPQKRPSYVGISCSVSGYSKLTRYNSRLREGFLSRSRDSSPVAPRSPPDPVPPAETQVQTPGHTSRVSLIKQQLREGFNLTDDAERGRDSQRYGRKVEQSRSLSVDRGYLRHYRTVAAAAAAAQQHRPNGTPANGHGTAPARPQLNGTVTVTNSSGSYSRQVHRADSGSPATPQQQPRQSSHESSPETTVITRSFVQARIERLYGPGALCSGFRRLNLSRTLPAAGRSGGRPAPLRLGDDEPPPDGDQPPPPSPGLPVFRHLRPEFRQQLPVKSAALVRRVPPPADTSPTQTAVPPITAADPPLIRPAVSLQSEPAPPPSPPPPSTSAASLASSEQAGPQPEKPGHKFIKVLDEETSRILALATRAENDLNTQQLSPELEGKWRAAKGKAKLLIAQKFQQFRGLCEKNINQPDDDPFPTTGDDLQGFWDMVLIQVHHINSLMDELQQIRDNNWQLPEKAEPDLSVNSVSSTPNSKSSTPNRRSGGGGGAAQSEAAKNRAAARKKMAEERRRLMEEKRKQMKASSAGTANAGVEIFVPEDK